MSCPRLCMKVHNFARSKLPLQNMVNTLSICIDKRQSIQVYPTHKGQFEVQYLVQLQLWTTQHFPNFKHLFYCLGASVISLHLLECAFCTQLTPRHVYLVTHTMVTAIAVLLLLVLVCWTVCCCSFESRTFCLTVLILYRRCFCFSDGDRGALRLIVKSAVHKYANLHIHILL